MSSLMATQGDYGYTLTFNVKDSTYLPYDLTSKDVELRAKINNYNTTALSVTCSSATPTTGVCSYVVQDGDFDVSGVYNLELIITTITPTMNHMTAQGMILTINPRSTL